MCTHVLYQCYVTGSDLHTDLSLTLTWKYYKNGTALILVSDMHITYETSTGMGVFASCISLPSISDLRYHPPFPLRRQMSYSLPIRTPDIILPSFSDPKCHPSFPLLLQRSFSLPSQTPMSPLPPQTPHFTNLTNLPL